jgi:hypothetical protein
MPDPFPFIVGRGRSGTTLLRAMLDTHPIMAVPPESHFVVPLIKRRRALEKGGQLSVNAVIADLRRRYGFQRWDLDLRAVEERLREAQPLDLAGGIREVFSLYAERRGKSRYAEKTPINVLHIPLLAAAFPEARFIHLIRDGRDVALSYLDTDFGASTLSESAVQWRRFVRTGMRDGARLGSGRYREVRYEELVERPAAVLRSVCSFLELPFDQAMLSYHTRAEDLLRRTSHAEHHGRIGLPPTAGLRDWRRDMEVDDLLLFEAIAGDLLDELDYPRGAREVPRNARRSAGRARRTQMIRRLPRRIGRSLRLARNRAVARIADGREAPEKEDYVDDRSR